MKPQLMALFREEKSSASVEYSVVFALLMILVLGATATLLRHIQGTAYTAIVMQTDRPMQRRILRLPEVIDRVGVGKTTIYDRMKKGEFPPRAKLLQGSRTVGWFEDEIDEYIAQIEHARTKPPAGIARATAATQSAGIPTVPCRPAPPPSGNVAKPKAARKTSSTSPSPAEPDLIATSIDLFGRTVYMHKPSGRLLMDVGFALTPFLEG